MKVFFLLMTINILSFSSTAQETLQVDFQVVFKTDPPDARKAILYVDQKESIFIEDRPHDISFSEGGSFVFSDPQIAEPTKQVYYKEINSKDLESNNSLIIEISADLNPKKNEKIPDETPNSPHMASDTLIRNTDIQHWTMHNQHKIIAGFITYKATCEYKGKNWVAWFAPDIRIASGPWKLYGLPGMILEAYDEQKEIYFRGTRVIENPKTVHPRILEIKNDKKIN